MKLEILFSPGSGGHWLGALISHLMSPDRVAMLPSINGVNFHNNTRQGIKVWHGNGNNSNHIVAPTMKNYIVLYTDDFFTSYINHVLKGDRRPGIQSYSLTVSHSLRFRHLPKNLDAALIHRDPEKFAEQLFVQLDKNQIKYLRNVDVVLQAIKYYKDTCIDPTAYYAKWDTDIWLGWALGVTKEFFDFWPPCDTIAETHQLVMPYKDFILEFTNKNLYDNK